MRSRARGGHVSHWYIFRKPNFFNRAVSPNEVEVRNIMEWRDLEVRIAPDDGVHSDIEEIFFFGGISHSSVPRAWHIK